MRKFTIGIDYGTNSVRAVVVDCSNGKEASTAVFNYPSGEQGIILDPKDHNVARQHPCDYIAGLEISVKQAIKKAFNYKGFSPSAVIGIGVDTTGSTPIPVDEQCVPLAFQKKWRRNPAAMAWLWKDHSGHYEAAQITQLARKHRPEYVQKYGGTYSSEWFWSKIWHCLNTSPEVFNAAYSWIELADYIPAVLAGVKNPRDVKRGICAAGHKAIYDETWGGLPDKEFLKLLSPELAELRDRLFDKAYDASTAAGYLCDEWASKLGLPKGIVIAIGAFDAHYGAIGAGIKEGTLVKIIGTSTCDCAVQSASKPLANIPGICGTVLGSILPGYYGLEAGQSAVGDIFKWFVEKILGGNESIHEHLTKAAKKIGPGQSGLLALDWNNGNRTILVDQRLSGLLIGQTLYTTQAEIYRALIEATAFGARAILERFKEYGVAIDTIICCGGIAEKNPLLMQIYADVTGCTMAISKSSQTCALGSAIAAAVIAGSAKGGYDTFEQAQEAMTGIKKIKYFPQPSAQSTYNRLYKLYITLHDAFGGVKKDVDMSGIMKELISLKEESLNVN